MEIETLIKKMKEINKAFLDFFEATDDHEVEFKTLIDVLEKQKILENKDEIQLLFQLISKITDNHYRTSDFFDKLEKIFQYLIKDNPSPISYFIPDYTKYNKRILYLLLDKGFVKPDEQFINQYLRSKPTKKKFMAFLIKKKEPDVSETYYYLYPKVKIFLEDKIQKQIEEEILEKYKEEVSVFDEKCRIGENDSYICSLIRSDSVEEFIVYVNRTNLSLLTKINPSIYETHSFLIDKEPTLIEYAAFFGAIQIIQYLKYNNVPLTSSLWFYSIYSNNPDLIHFLEENEIKPERNKMNFGYFFETNTKKNPFEDVLIESIKCHHNDISNYIIENFYEQTQTDDQNKFINFSETISESLNFAFFPNEILSMICNAKKGKGFILSQLCLFLTNVTIPSSITEIEDSAFKGCSLLMQITIPSSVKKIGNSAFSGCLSLRQITIPSSVTSIGDSAFGKCTSLTNIEFEMPSSLKSIGKNCFIECKSLTRFFIPSSVTSYELQSFEGFESLTEITIPSFVTSIGNNGFNGCSSLTQITIPSSVTRIANYAFSGCSSLRQITIPSSVTEIGKYVFSDCSSLIKIKIPYSVTKIGDYAFNRCSSLAQITIPSSVISFGNHSFTGIKKIEIKGDINIFPNNLFSGCSSLEQITIPSSVTEIGNYSFYHCLSLTQITIPSSVTLIGDSAFSGCSALKQIEIPSSVIKIGNSAFSGCSSLRQITIPSSIAKIGNSVFSKCSSLKQIEIPSSVIEIENSAFYGCSSLTQITIPSSVTKIGNSAFSGCSLLSAETIESINNIQSNSNNNNNILKH